MNIKWTGQDRTGQDRTRQDRTGQKKDNPVGGFEPVTFILLHLASTYELQRIVNVERKYLLNPQNMILKFKNNFVTIFFVFVS